MSQESAGTQVPTDHRTRDDDTDDDALTVDTVLERIESLAVAIVQALDSFRMPVLEQLQPTTTASTTTARSTTFTTMVATLSAARTRKPTMTKRFNLQQCRSFTSILLVLAYCHSLLLPDDENVNDGTTSVCYTRRTTTTREVYYFYVTHFRSQRECDMAIWDACQLLQVPRYALGLQAGSRGWFCGDVQLMSRRLSHTQPMTTTHTLGRRSVRGRTGLSSFGRLVATGIATSL